METQAEKLQKLINLAIEGGWSNNFRDYGEYELHHGAWFDAGAGEYGSHVYPVDVSYELIFDHQFAKALFREAKVPDGEEIDDSRTKLGLYSAEGGGYEGYGDYVLLDFNGDPWQYHLQQAVISADPVSYIYEQVKAKEK